MKSVSLRWITTLLILFFCVAILYFIPTQTKTPPASILQVEEVPATPVPPQYLGDRVELVRYFEHYFQITDWRHITTNGRDKAIGVSGDDQIVVEFENDPIALATLTVDLGGDNKVGAQVIVGFLHQLLPDEEYKAAVGLLDGGGELVFADRNILMYHDMEIGKAIFEIKWRGE